MSYYEIIDDSMLRCGECPMWDHRNGIFYWSDMLTGKIFSYNPKTGEKKTVCEGKNVSGFTMNEGGGFVCATHQGLYLWNEKRGWKLIASEFAGQALHSNDATADARGRFIFGTTFYDQTVGDNYERGRLYSVDTDGTISIIDEGWGLPNGIGFSPDNKIMYATETVDRVIYAYDYDVESGKAANRRIAVKIPDNEGIPDGMTVDAEGCIWSAQWYGYCIARYSPEGELLLKIHVPSGQTSSVMFGGDDLTDIYVTTAAEVVRLSVAPKGYDFDAPHNGYTYRFNKGIRGLPEHFANIKL
jgi:sugar lactone lactonase YvrE